MKRKISLILAAALLCTAALYGCSTMTDDYNLVSSSSATNVSSADTFTPHRFGKGDLTVNGNVTLGMTIEEVKAVLGQPDSENTFTNDDFIYGAYTRLDYDALHLSFFDTSSGNNFTLGTVWGEDDSVTFAGGLHIGSTKQDVLTAFTQDSERKPLYFANTAESYGDYIYGDTNASFIQEARPQGVLEYAYIDKWSLDNGYDTNYYMQYYYADPLIWSEEDDEGNVSYSGDLYSLIFTVDGETDLVTNIVLSYSDVF